MISDDELMRRLVKCPRWEWTRGLLGHDSVAGCDVLVTSVRDGVPHDRHDNPLSVPVADDPLLPGWVLRLVREATDDPGAHAVLREGRWFVVNGKMHAQVFRMCDTEIEALVLALEAAPVKL